MDDVAKWGLPPPAVIERAIAEAPRERTARLISWTPWLAPNPSLVGHADVDFDGWVVFRIPIFRRKDGGLSAGAPSAAEVDRDGVQQRDAAGKRKFWAVISFSGVGKERWQRAVLAALADGGIVL
ncbi:MAG TPA: hypothetical protein VIJ55_03715 [Acetobacteraceae bacterium]